MHIGGIELVKVRENLWEIPATGKMKVPGRVYISQKMIERGLRDDEACCNGSHPISRSTSGN